MIRLNRTTEYGLIALQHMSGKRSRSPHEVTSAREVADSYGLPFEITAKTLQRLKDTRIIQSAQGAKGGYLLARDLKDITVAEFLELMEGPQVVVACISSGVSSAAAPAAHTPCDYSGHCNIKGMMSDLNQRVTNLLAGIRLSELTDRRPSAGLQARTAEWATTAGGFEP